MKAIVIYHTRYGNTEKIATSLATGLMKASSGMKDVFCVNIKDMTAIDNSLEEYDLVCIGAPTEGFTAPKPIKEFFRKLKGVSLAGKYGFAFDTKVDFRLSGSAAKSMEKELKSQGLQIIAPHESAIVYTLKEDGTISGARLKDGEDKRFEQIGLQLGTELSSKRTQTVSE